MRAKIRAGRPPREAGSLDTAALERSPLYSEELGIDLGKGTDAALFRWFLASALMGGRISEATAKNTYRSFVRHRLTSPKAILKAGWDFLVNPVMREGHYIRYDESKSTKLLRDCQKLIDDYGGRLSQVRDKASDARDLERRLDDFYGVGPVTTNIFLRELRPFWEKSDPEPLPVVKELALRYGVDLERYDRKSLVFARIEAGLIRRRHETRARLPPKATGRRNAPRR